MSSTKFSESSGLPTGSPTASRRTAREIAFQYLYGHLPLDPEGQEKKVLLSKSSLEIFCRNFGYGTPDEFCWKLIDGTGQNLPTIDQTLRKLSTNWRLERMPRVDLTLLRLCTYEILYCPEIPKSVSINEVIELAKKFGTEDSHGFLNGILDKLEKQLFGVK